MRYTACNATIENPLFFGEASGEKASSTETDVVTVRRKIASTYPVGGGAEAEHRKIANTCDVAPILILNEQRNRLKLENSEYRAPL